MKPYGNSGTHREKTDGRGMKPCGRAMMYGKGRGGRASTHTECARQCAQLRLRTHRVCRAVRSASLVHTRVCRTGRGIRSRTHRVCRAVRSASLAHTSFLMFSLYGKHCRMFYAFRPHVSIIPSSKCCWHGICSCRAALFRPIVDNIIENP